jgi:hypothetical protein
MNKYHNNVTVTSDGIKHASQKEATRWCELKLLERAGKISDLQRQVEFELIPCQYETYERFSKRGDRLGEGMRVAERKVSYIADFVYTDTETGRKVVEDTKGMRTKEYIIKRKLMRYIHHIAIKEV